MAGDGGGGGEGGDGWSRSEAAGGGVNPLSMEGSALTMIRQLDVHPCSKRFLTLTTTPTALQLVQPCRGSGYTVDASSERAGTGEGSSSNSNSVGAGTATNHRNRTVPPYQRRPPPACVVQNYDLATDTAGDNRVRDASEEDRSCEPGAACFHDFSPVFCVGTGSSVRLYGMSHLSTMATYMDVDLA
ncbi:hypothetical protein ABB37_08557 [Leptomonas pyrrhocoris]|uniref:Uncharacterized protein n=1 Tax=Leptomonas pyrrhocoris TaxID=157538 RepID=A0A0N0VDC5_LEPPY|nr:hypothetical protein ABB37_08557 [Leptomonas pyrrhocoris]KPA75252.1 hypothetical protein ABB37_08557 [Leptomonas pyrrhocoris]|eukprot:XP_015653691.1 hypothetical protein ABB37_08557 [Leptomonas pyrrhocoris]